MNYKKEYKKYLASSILDTANNKIASTSFITAFAVYLGLSNFAIGIYAVLDTITNIVQIFAAPLFSRIGQSKYVVLTNYTIYRLSSICFAFIPFITKNIELRTILFFIFAGFDIVSLIVIFFSSIIGLYVFILINISINAIKNTIKNNIINPYNSYPFAVNFGQQKLKIENGIKF